MQWVAYFTTSLSTDVNNGTPFNRRSVAHRCSAADGSKVGIVTVHLPRAMIFSSTCWRNSGAFSIIGATSSRLQEAFDEHYGFGCLRIINLTETSEVTLKEKLREESDVKTWGSLKQYPPPKFLDIATLEQIISYCTINSAARENDKVDMYGKGPSSTNMFSWTLFFMWLHASDWFFMHSVVELGETWRGLKHHCSELGKSIIFVLQTTQIILFKFFVYTIYNSIELIPRAKRNLRELRLVPGISRAPDPPCFWVKNDGGYRLIVFASVILSDGTHTHRL